MQTPATATLETSRLRLRPMTGDDAGALLAIFSDPNVMASFGGELFDRAQMEQWVERNLAHMDLEDGPAAELGYDFRSDHWNQGYASEAAAAARDHALRALGLPRLVSLIRVGNRASQRVAEKLGMRCVGTLSRHGREYWEYDLEAAA